MDNRKTWKEILIEGLDDELEVIKIDDVLYSGESLDDGLSILDKYPDYRDVVFTAWDKKTVHFIVNDSDYGDYIESAPRNPSIKI